MYVIWPIFSLHIIYYVGPNKSQCLLNLRNKSGYWQIRKDSFQIGTEIVLVSGKRKKHGTNLLLKCMETTGLNKFYGPYISFL